MVVAFLAEIFGAVGNFALSTISSLGYAGIFFLMVLESMVIPVPSELVMPFAGFLAAQGNFNILFIIVVSTLGSITGSLISYYIGKRWGTQLIESYGKYILVNHEDLKKTEAWFTKRGEITIFFSRLVPVVRHLISLVAGVGRMKVKKFSIYTIAGAAVWNSFLVYLGHTLGQHWNEIAQYTEELDIVIVILLIIGIVYYIYRHLSRRKNNISKK